MRRHNPKYNHFDNHLCNNPSKNYHNYLYIQNNNWKNFLYLCPHRYPHRYQNRYQNRYHNKYNHMLQYTDLYIHLSRMILYKKLSQLMFLSIRSYMMTCNLIPYMWSCWLMCPSIHLYKMMCNFPDNFRHILLHNYPCKLLRSRRIHMMLMWSTKWLVLTRQHLKRVKSLC